jgi:hypothetical protein
MRALDVFCRKSVIAAPIGWTCFQFRVGQSQRCVVEKSAGDLLDKRDRFGNERRAFVGIVGILDLGALGGLVPGVWCILATPVPVVLELVEGCRDVSGH